MGSRRTAFAPRNSLRSNSRSLHDARRPLCDTCDCGLARIVLGVFMDVYELVSQ